MAIKENTMSEFYYNNTKDMAPRDGKAYSTTYYQQSLDERKRVQKHINKTITDIKTLPADAVEPWLESGLKGHNKKEKRGKYSVFDVIRDMDNEQKKTQKNGLPGDFAKAPIDRWNKVFEGCPDRTIVMVQGSRSKNAFDNHFSEG
jgi:hypothetical protein